MKKRSRIAQAAFDLAKPVAEEMGLELVDAEYKKEGQKVFLRLFIDKQGGLDIDSCESFSRVIDPILDESLKYDADYFEVSSPGLTRPLEDEEDFIRYMGELVDISLFKEKNGKKSFIARIVDANEKEVCLELLEDSEKNGADKINVKYDEMSKVVRHIDF